MLESTHYVYKVSLQKSILSDNSTLLAYHHQNSTNACFLVAEALKAFEALAPAANTTKRLTRSATGSRKWWCSPRSVDNSLPFSHPFVSNITEGRNQLTHCVIHRIVNERINTSNLFLWYPDGGQFVYKVRQGI